MNTKSVDQLELNGHTAYKIEVNTGLSEEGRKEIATGLSKFLADSYNLMVKTHNYHWNVRGNLFHTIHEMTEEQYNDLFEAVDDVAERIRALGFTAPGSLKDFEKISIIKDGDASKSQMEMIADLLESHESVAKTARKVLKIADNNDDEVTVDMLTNRLNEHEKASWMWRSFLEH